MKQQRTYGHLIDSEMHKNPLISFIQMIHFFAFCVSNGWAFKYIWISILTSASAYWKNMLAEQQQEGLIMSGQLQNYIKSKYSVPLQIKPLLGADISTRG